MMTNDPLTLTRVKPQTWWDFGPPLAKMRLNGNGPIYCKLGRRVVYRRADLEAWLQSRTTRDTSDANAWFLKALTVAHPR